MRSVLAAIVVMLVPNLASAAMNENRLDIVLRYTAAIIQGTVADATHTFSPDSGPRAVVSFPDVNVIAGDASLAGAPLHLKLLEGFLPSGNFFFGTHVPTFARGQRYIVFLLNDTYFRWYDSPVAGQHAYAVMTTAGRDVVVNQDGYVVVGIEDGRILLSENALFDMNRDTATPFAPPIALADPSGNDLERAVDAAKFIAQVHAFMSATGLLPSGVYANAPDPHRVFASFPIFDAGNVPNPCLSAVCVDKPYVCEECP